MDKHPFSSSATSQESASSLRRSARIDFVTPVFLSGRDATGQRFRELTQTEKVNLHGCKLRTSYHVLVGMLVTLECPRAGATGKAVCVRVWDAPEGVGGHAIAVQLVKPQNLWGVPEPPADWAIVAKAMVEGPRVQAESPTEAAEPPSAPAPTAPPPQSSPAPAAPPRVPLEPTSSLGTLSVDLRLAELEGRSARLLESFLDIMRSQAEELARTSLEEFRQQVEVLLRHAEERLRQIMEQR